MDTLQTQPHTAPLPPTDDPGDPPSFPVRVWQTFTAPGRLFETFRAYAPWVAAVLLTTALGALVLALVPRELMIEQIREALRKNPAASAQMPDPAKMADMGKTMGLVGAVIGPFISAFVLAGVLTLIFGMLMHGGATYRQHLGVVAHVLLIPALGALLTLPLQIAKGDLQLQLSLALLTPFLDAGSFAFRLLNGLNIFALWAIVVAGLGMHKINRRISWTTATLILLAVYVVLLGGVAALRPA